MTGIPGFEGAAAHELLYQGERTQVIRLPEPDGTGWLVRKLGLGPGAAARLAHESMILNRLADLPGVAHLHGVPDADPTWITLEDVRGPTLAAWSAAERPDVAAIVDVALGLAETLAAVHRRGVVHKDINPANVVLTGDKRSPVLIDFDLATTFVQERPGFTHESQIAGTLAYLAPEQTGRTGRPVDQRADLYALGCTLYLLATGEPPFGNCDPLQLIHDHLARLPAPPAELNPTLPALLSQMILRLLEKEPDRRYQSAEGLVHDLIRLRERQERGDDEPFPLGEQDFALRLAAVSRPVGRETEIQALRTVFEEVRAGRGRGVLICGAPGVGKTMLIDELRPMVAESGGWFVAGKFDQFRRDLASDAVNQSLRAFGRLLLAEPEAELVAQRARILEALGPNAGLITPLLPEFEVLLGPTKPVALPADAKEATALLVNIGVDLLRAVVSPARPMVMVLDDLQWAAPTPISLVDAIFTDGNLPGVLLVGAYREAEVDVAHPLSALFSRWERLGVTPLSLRLGDLPPTDLSELLAEILRLPADRAAELTEVIGARTGGNPYDTVELLNALRQEGVLASGSHGWTWDATTIRQNIGSGDAVDLLIARIDRLPEPTGKLLETIACLGGGVDLGLLHICTGLSEATLADQLNPALEDGLLVKAQDGEDSVQFRHDRVQQAAYARLGAVNQVAVHLELARSLARLPDRAALAAEQYLPAVDAVDDAGECRRVAELLLAAGAASQLLNAPLAERYLATAATLLENFDSVPGSKAEDDDLRIAVQIHWQVALCSLGRLDEADEVFRTIELSCADPVQLAKSGQAQVLSLTLRARSQEAVALGLRLLSELGLTLPEPEDLGAEIGKGLDALRLWVSNSDLAADVERPEVDDPQLVAIAEVINRLMPAAFICDPPRMAWFAMESYRRWIEFGPCAALIGPLGPVSFIFVPLQQDYLTGYAVTSRVLKMSERLGYAHETAQARLAFVAGAQHWVEPVDDVLNETRLTREGLLLGGDLQMVAYTYSISVSLLLVCGRSLESLSAEVDAALAFVRRTGNEYIARTTECYLQLIKAMRGQTDAQGSFTDADFDEAGFLLAYGSNPLDLVGFHYLRGFWAAVLGDTEDLIALAAAAGPLLRMSAAMYQAATGRLIQVLALAQRIRRTPSDRAELLAELDEHRDWLAARAVSAPENFLYLQRFVEAERAWAVGDLAAAAAGFDAAMYQLETLTRPLYRAWITERAALLHLEQGLTHTGRMLLREALSGYAAWGVIAKVNRLTQDHPFLITSAEFHAEGTSRPAPSTVQDTLRGTSDSIDLLAVLRAAQTLSSETNLDRLRDQVVDVLGEMTGATAVRLLLWNDEARSWSLLSDGEASSLTLDEAGAQGLLPLSAFRYAERTGEPLLVGDATKDDRFARDPYLDGVERCSLLVVPIMMKGSPRAMLVLENRLSAYVFTAARLDTVMLIAGQLAVCLDNALAERFRSLVNRSSDLILVCDREGVLSYASAASADLLGVDSAQLIGRDVTDLIHPDDWAAVHQRLQHPDAEGGKSPTWRVVNPDGVQRWVLGAVTDLSSEPAVCGMVLHLRDVTERRNLEGELRHAQKLESVGQLAAGIAHEINTPIQFIGDNLKFLSGAFDDLMHLVSPARVEVAAGGAAAPSTGSRVDVDFLLEEIPSAITETLEGVSRVATIVRAMKAFGHSGEGKAAADLNEAVRSTLVVASSEIKRVADVVTDLGELPPLWCNIGDINQAILNVVVNAAHAIGEAATQGRGRGTITVRTRCEEDHVVLEVQDTGAGIPREVAGRIFEQFFTTKDVGVGTGQGLALTHTLIHTRHNGTITFDSEPGVGTTFTIRLPYRADSADNSASAADPTWSDR